MRAASPTKSDATASARKAGTLSHVMSRTTSATPRNAMIRRGVGSIGVTERELNLNSPTHPGSDPHDRGQTPGAVGCYPSPVPHRRVHLEEHFAFLAVIHECRDPTSEKTVQIHDRGLTPGFGEVGRGLTPGGGVYPGRRGLMNLRIRDRCGALQEIEIASAVGLGHMLGVHEAESARILDRRRRPISAPP